MKSTIHRILTRKYIVIPVMVFALYCLVGWIVIPHAVCWYFPRFALEHLHSRVGIGAVHMNPLCFSIVIDDLRLDSPDGMPIAAFAKLSGEMGISSLFRGVVTLKKIHLQKPVLHLEVDADGQVNLSKIKPSSSSQSESETTLFPGILQMGTLTDGIIDIIDRRINPAFHVILQNINLSLNDISTIENKKGSYLLTAETPDAETLRCSGSLILAPLTAGGNLSVKAVRVSNLLNYFKGRLNFDSTSGIINVSTDFRLDSDADPQNLHLMNLDLGLSDLSLKWIQDGLPFFQADRLHVEGGELDFGGRSFTVSKISLNTGSVDFSPDRNGQIRFPGILSASSGSAKPSETPPTIEGSQWEYLIQAVEINGFQSAVSTTAAGQPGAVWNIQDFTAHLSHIDGKSPVPFDVDFSVKQGGRIALRGKMNPAPPLLETAVLVTDLSLMPVQPFLDSYAALTLQSGALSLQGDLTCGTPDAGPGFSYTGKTRLDHLRITEPASQKTFIGCDSLSIPRIQWTMQPDNLEINEIILDKPAGKFVISKDRHLNLLSVIKKRPGQPESADIHPQSTSVSDKHAFPVHIGKIRVEKGAIDFADLSLQPQFMTQITDLNGVVSGFSSLDDHPAQIQFDGRVDSYGMTQISGKINLFSPSQSTDLNMIFRNVEMTKLTPYSGRFAGRRITSGKLSMELKYRIENNRLVGNNQIIIDQLSLGEHLDSPEAVNLPLDLAVALLRDADGKIDIGLPVTGDLNDPQFSYGQLFWKALRNLITQMVTSPFRALGAMFSGSGEHFDSVVFDPAHTDILPPEKEKLQKIAEMLRKRPQLKLTIQGRCSMASDGPEIRKLHVRQTVAAITGEKVSREERFAQIDLTDSAIRDALKKMFVKQAGITALTELEQTAGQQNGETLQKPLAMAQAIYDRLVAAEPVSVETLSAIAAKRAQEVAGELKTAGKISPDSLVISLPDTETSGPPSVGFTLDAKNVVR